MPHMLGALHCEFSKVVVLCDASSKGTCRVLHALTQKPDQDSSDFDRREVNQVMELAYVIVQQSGLLVELLILLEHLLRLCL